MSNVGKTMYQVMLLTRCTKNKANPNWVPMSNNTRWDEKEARALGKEKLDFALHGDHSMGGVLGVTRPRNDGTEFKLVIRTMTITAEEEIFS